MAFCTYSSDYVNDGSLVCDFLVLFPRLVRHEWPQAVDVDGRAEELVVGLVEVPHTHFAKVTRMAGEKKQRSKSVNLVALWNVEKSLTSIMMRYYYC